MTKHLLITQTDNKVKYFFKKPTGGSFKNNFEKKQVSNVSVSQNMKTKVEKKEEYIKEIIS